MTDCIPKYIETKKSGLLGEKIDKASDFLESCALCPRQCRVDRAKGEKGYCSTGEKAVIASFAPHFGEEPQLVGEKGSGTIFFSNCSLKCVFCQNYDISIKGSGEEAEIDQIASVMIYLQQAGCHNINFVTPTHVVPQILKALDVAIDSGLDIPLVYNSSGYEDINTLKLLKDVVDIYMPDFKFWGSETAKLYCNAADYPEKARKALIEMHDQVGDLRTDKDGVACSGLLVRHLVMPGLLQETYRILKFLKEEVSADTHVNVMSQYHPAGKAFRIQELAEPLTPAEFRQAKKMAEDFGLKIIN